MMIAIVTIVKAEILLCTIEAGKTFISYTLIAGYSP
jgi:hypothetical protein